MKLKIEESDPLTDWTNSEVRDGDSYWEIPDETARRWCEIQDAFCKSREEIAAFIEQHPEAETKSTPLYHSGLIAEWHGNWLEVW